MAILSSRPPQASELQIHIAVIQHLKYRARKGVVFWHSASGELRDKRTAAKLKAMGVVPGIPDIMIIADGKTYGLELKTTHGRLSSQQKAMMAHLDDAGAYTATAYGIDQAIAILTRWGILVPNANMSSHSTTGEARL